MACTCDRRARSSDGKSEGFDLVIITFAEVSVYERLASVEEFIYRVWHTLACRTTHITSEYGLLDARIGFQEVTAVVAEDQ